MGETPPSPTTQPPTSTSRLLGLLPFGLGNVFRKSFTNIPESCESRFTCAADRILSTTATVLRDLVEHVRPACAQMKQRKPEGVRWCANREKVFAKNSVLGSPRKPNATTPPPPVLKRIETPSAESKVQILERLIEAERKGRLAIEKILRGQIKTLKNEIASFEAQEFVREASHRLSQSLRHKALPSVIKSDLEEIRAKHNVDSRACLGVLLNSLFNCLEERAELGDEERVLYFFNDYCNVLGEYAYVEGGGGESAIWEDIKDPDDPDDGDEC
ncbi:hypothetical protein HK104_009408 [Borealophlyctis nickersoniae]|nr:hypothetical protein HK104_009408 [Borealophlyctis nickersoniae]